MAARQLQALTPQVWEPREDLLSGEGGCHSPRPGGAQRGWGWRRSPAQRPKPGEPPSSLTSSLIEETHPPHHIQVAWGRSFPLRFLFSSTWHGRFPAEGHAQGAATTAVTGALSIEPCGSVTSRVPALSLRVPLCRVCNPPAASLGRLRPPDRRAAGRGGPLDWGGLCDLRRVPSPL